VSGRIRVCHDDESGLIGVELTDLDGDLEPRSFWLTPFEAMSIGMSLTNAATAMRCRVPLSHRLREAFCRLWFPSARKDGGEREDHT